MAIGEVSIPGACASSRRRGLLIMPTMNRAGKQKAEFLPAFALLGAMPMNISIFAVLRSATSLESNKPAPGFVWNLWRERRTWLWEVSC
jgi:hypothetical protein